MINGVCLFLYRMCALKEVLGTSITFSTLLLVLTLAILLNDLCYSLKIFRPLVDAFTGPKCMCILHMHTNQAFCRWHKYHTFLDHCKYIRYCKNLWFTEYNELLLMQVRQNWSESEATSTVRVSGQRWNQSWLALDGSDADPNGLLCYPVTLYTSRYTNSFISVRQFVYHLHFVVVTGLQVS